MDGTRKLPLQDPALLNTNRPPRRNMRACHETHRYDSLADADDSIVIKFIVVIISLAGRRGRLALTGVAFISVQ